MKCPECAFVNPEGRSDCASCGKLLEALPAATTDPDAPTMALPGGTPPAAPGTPPPTGPTGWAVPASPGDPQSSGVGFAPIEVGSVLSGRYEIVGMLGQGGMGAVYHAVDLELDRPVALKVVRPDLTSHVEVMSRFKQELILAREVTHPNVVRIYDLGMDHGHRFITMEFVEGQDLKAVMTSGRRFSPEEIVEIGKQICRALREAHKAGIVHRDLKPQNVMLDGQDQVKVMDFGVARSAETSGLTQTGQMIGTPDYMSPEQAKGEPTDARSDLFSLGIILYIMLVRKVPYPADTTIGTLVKRTQEPAIPPSKVEPSVPRHLNDVVVKCLQMDRDLRYQSAQELLDDLETGRAPRVPSRLTRLRHRVRATRPATRWAALALTALMLVLGALVLNDRPSPPPAPVAAVQVEPTSLAILPFRNSTGDPEIDWLQSSLAEMLRTDIGQSSQLRTVPPDRVHQILSDLKLDVTGTLSAAVVRRLADHSNAQMILQGQYSKLGERIRIDATLHDFDRELSIPIKAEAADEGGLLEAIGQLAESIRDNMDLSTDALREIEAAAFTPSSDSIEALRLYNEGLQLERQGNYLDALESFRGSAEADSRFALAHARLGQAYANLGRDAEGEQASRRAVELSRELPEYERNLIAASHATIVNDHEQAVAAYRQLAQVAPGDPEINLSLADLYEQSGDFADARDRLQIVLENDPNYVDALYALGRVEIRAGNVQQSLDPLNRALTLTVQADNDEGRGRVLHAIGIAYSLLDRPHEALRRYDEALEIRKRLDQKSGISATLAEIADVQQTLGNYDEARSSLEESLALSREIGDRGGIGDSLIGLGNFHFDLREADPALRYYKDALQIQREIGDEVTEALCLNNIGIAYVLKGESGDAFTNFEQALRLRERIGVPYDIGETLHNLAEATAKLGQYDSALDYYLRALEQMRLAEESIGTAAALYGVGVLFEAQGRFRAALESHGEAQEILEASGDEGYWRCLVGSRYGASLGAAGRFDEGRAVLDESAKLAGELEIESLEAQVLNFQGDNYYYRGDLAQAASFYDQAHVRATAADDPETLLVTRLNQARVALLQGRPVGVDRLEDLTAEANRHSFKLLAAEASILAAESLFARGNTDAARNLVRGPLNDLERAKLRPLLARSLHLLGRIERTAGNAEEAELHDARARRLLEEIREEGGEENPLLRQDLQSLFDDVGGVAPGG